MEAEAKDRRIMGGLTDEANRPRLHRDDERSRDSEKMREVVSSPSRYHGAFPSREHGRPAGRGARSRKARPWGRPARLSRPALLCAPPGYSLGLRCEGNAGAGTALQTAWASGTQSCPALTTARMRTRSLRMTAPRATRLTLPWASRRS
jgi:hypothetical protein